MQARREVNYNETALARAAEADAAAEAERLRPPPAPGKRRLVSVLRGAAPPGAAAAAAGDDTELLRRLLPDCGVGPDGSIGEFPSHDLFPPDARPLASAA